MSNSKTFWTAPPSGMYAKRNNIFLIQFDFGVKTSSPAHKKDKDILEAMSGIQFEAKSVNLPSFSFSQNERSKNLAGGGDVAVVPGVLDWTPVTLTFADIHHRKPHDDPRIDINKPTSKFSSLYESMLYAFDRALGSKAMHGATAFDHNRFRRFFENIMIISIDADGNLLDKWTLKGTWPVEFKSPELNYDNDAIREFSITLDYVIAEYTSYDARGKARETLFEANSSMINDVDEGNFPGG